MTEDSIQPDVIKPISSNTVHRICSGQVVLSLAIAVKELVENAIDANATNIEVRLKEYGSELIEVSDNGSGVRKENFEALTLKHYTSKLKQFNDLESLGTLGFRGEALSSLCALSDLIVTTRHQSAEHGTKISYDSNGKIKSTVPAARVIGTTVSLENLFKSLPVRRKEFLKNLKKEYSKMCQLLYAYCLVSTKIKFSCTNQSNASSRATVISTEGTDSVRDNIISVFGTKQIQSLVEVNMIDPDEEIMSEYKLQPIHGEPLPFNFEFIISSAEHGKGRSTSDRQFFYVNGRPCEPHKIIKLVNGMYKQFNLQQYPFVFLNIILERSHVDVNVTPDKRQVFLTKEKLLLATIKTSILEVFKSSPSTCVENITADVSRFIEMNAKRSIDELDCKLKKNTTKESLLDVFRKSSPKVKKVPELIQPKLTENNSFKIISDEPVNKKPKLDMEASIPKSPISHENNEPKLKSYPINSKLPMHVESNELSPSISENKVKKVPELIQPKLTENNSFKIDISDEPVNKKTKLDMEASIPKSPISHKNNEPDLKNSPINSTLPVHVESKELSPSISENKTILKPDPVISVLPEKENEDVSERQKLELQKEIVLVCKKNLKKPDLTPPKRSSVTIRASINYITELLQNRDAEETPNGTQVRFRSEITPAANKTAEEELKKQITKDMFKKMQVVGQFNLGFIIAKLENDLFIVDQHATDEKYNFEQLQLTTVMENQLLVNPSSLELSAANEELLIENLDIFQKNGFKFMIDNSAPATKKVKLSAIPISKNYIFGKDDIEEMLFMMQEEVNLSVCRPSRIRSMFASRACRKSVMVGCPLNQNDMRRLLDHMGEIDQPWNCPHGRPTIRHLVNLNLLENT